MLSRDDILRMAREAGFERIDYNILELERFAALLRNHMIADGWRQCAKEQRTTQHCGMVEQEREVCAREAGLILQKFRVEWPIIEEVIRAIRARSKE